MATCDTLLAEPAPPIATRLIDALSSEWTKLRSVKSNYWLLTIAAVTALGGSALAALADRSSHKPALADPVASTFLAWLEYPILAVGILGLLSFTSEYTSGQIRTTFAAVPQRLTVLIAKTSVAGIVALIFGEALAFASFLIRQAILTGHRGSIALTHPGVPAELLSGGLAICAIATLGVALGGIIRNTAGAVAALPALIHLPLLVLTLPHPWNDDIGKFTLLMAACQLVSEHPHAGLLPVPLSLAVLVAWPAVTLLAVGMLIKKRDA